MCSGEFGNFQSSRFFVLFNLAIQCAFCLFCFFFFVLLLGISIFKLPTIRKCNEKYERCLDDTCLLLRLLPFHLRGGSNR